MRRRLILATTAAFLAVPAAPAAGQSGAPVAGQADTLSLRGTISGRVIDDRSRTGLDGATITIAPAAAGALPGETRFLRATRSVATDADGDYRVEGITPGRYRLYVRRPGYRSTTLEVELRTAADSRVSIGLAVEPIALMPLEIFAEPSAPYGRARVDRGEAGRGRADAERIRQARHLSTDVRALTHDEVLEAVTLGETDLFRALQRLPGVSTRDDYTAELWTRGAGWDQTRVYFDGLPLFNPVHAAGVLSGMGPDGIGAAFLHPGVRPAGLGGGGAAVLDLRSRQGGGDRGLRGFGDVSLASARVALDQRILSGRGAWMLAARRSYLDWLVGGIGDAIDDPEVTMPYAFSDVTGRFDYRIDGDRRLEVSGLWSDDGIRGDLPDILHGNSAAWGNAVGRATLAAPLFGLRARHTVGVSRFRATVRESTPDPVLEQQFSAGALPPSDNSVLYTYAGTELEPDRTDARPPAWSAGYGVAYQRTAYDGPPPVPHARDQPVDAPALALDTDLAYGVLWGEIHWTPTARLTVEPALRIEAGPSVVNGGRLRLAPRLHARYEPAEGVSVSAGLGRSFEYTQALAPAGLNLRSFINAAHLWLLADDRVPALRSDLATLGAEAWLGDRWLASGNLYLRRATGLAVPDPSPGPIAADRPLWVEADNVAYGAELSVRRLVGRWTLGLGYSYGVSEMDAAGLRYTAPADRRHTVDITTMLRVGESLRVGAAYTAMSGGPFTRVFYRTSPDGGPCRTYAEPECTLEEYAAEPNAVRTPDYRSLDLLLDWNHAFGSWGLGLYLQLRNALGRENAGPYGGSGWLCTVDPHLLGVPCDGEFEVRDHFETGLPRLPLVGVRVTF